MGGKETGGTIKGLLVIGIPRPGSGDVAKGGERAKGPSKTTQFAFGRRIETAPMQPRVGK